MGAGADYDDMRKHGRRLSVFGGQHEHATLDVEMHVGDREVCRLDDLAERYVIAVARAGEDRAAALDEELPQLELPKPRILERSDLQDCDEIDEPVAASALREEAHAFGVAEAREPMGIELGGNGELVQFRVERVRLGDARFFVAHDTRAGTADVKAPPNCGMPARNGADRSFDGTVDLMAFAEILLGVQRSSSLASDVDMQLTAWIQQLWAQRQQLTARAQQLTA